MTENPKNSPNPNEFLVDTDQYFKFTFHESMLGKALVGLDGRLLKVNRTACTMLGYPEAELLTKTFRDISHPDDIAPTESRLQPVLDGKQTTNWLEKRYLRKDGTIVWALVQTVMIHAEDGSPLYRLTEAEDITERKLAEESLRRSEAKFRAIVENSDSGVAFLDANGNILYRSPNYDQINGFTSEERIGRNGFETVHPDDLERVRALFNEVLQRPDVPIQAEFRIQHKNGRWLWIDAIVRNLLKNPDVEAIAISARDSTQRKQAEESLRRSEAKFRAVVENGSDEFLFGDSEGMISYRSPGLLNINGYANEERVGYNGFEFVHPDDLENVRKVWSRVLAEPNTPLSAEYRHRHRDGSWRWVESTAQNLLNNPDVRQLILVTRDIHARKQAEKALQISEQAAQRANEQLRMVNETLANLTSGLDIEQLMQKLHEQCQQIGEIDTFYVLLYDDKTTTLSTLYFVKDGERRVLPPRNIRENPGLTGYVIQNPQTLYIPDSLNWPQERPRGIAQPGKWSRSIVVVPLLFRGKIIGILSMQNHEPNVYSPEQIQTLELFAPQIAIAIYNSRLYTDLRQRVQELETITQVSMAMRLAQTRAEMSQILLRDSMRILQAQGGALGILNGSTLSIQGAAGLVEMLQGQNIPENDGMIWRILRAGKAHFYDVQDGKAPSTLLSMLNEAKTSIQAGIVIPLKSGDLIIGVIFWGFTSPQPASDDQRRLAIAMAEMAGVALHRVSMSEALEKIVTDRSRELQTIYRVAASANPRLELGSVIKDALELILPAVHASSGAVLFWDEAQGSYLVLASQGLPAQALDYLQKSGKNSIEGWVLENRQPLVLADLSATDRIPFKHPGLLPFAALPMLAGERAVGVLDVSRPGGEPFNLEELTLLDFIADHLGLVVENSLLFKQVEGHAVLEERARVARALHDSVTQLLYSAMLYAEGSARLAENNHWDQVRANLHELSQITRQALQEMRLMVYELRSPTLHHDGLVHAIQNRLDAVEMRSGIQASIVADALPRLPEPLEEALYRIALEALNNSLKHSHAKTVTVFILCARREVMLCIRDDGIGFEVDGATKGGLGLVSMKERIERLGGQLTIRSALGAGCEVEATLPLSEAKLPARKNKPRKPLSAPKRK